MFVLLSLSFLGVLHAKDLCSQGTCSMPLEWQVSMSVVGTESIFYVAHGKMAGLPIASYKLSLDATASARSPQTKHSSWKAVV